MDLRIARIAKAEYVEYLAAYRSLGDGDPAAAERMRDLAARHPDDPLAALHAARAGRGERGVDITLS